MKKFKKAFIGILIFSFLFLNIPQIERVEAGNDIYPAELAVPNEPLVAGEEADFFIIINDEAIKKEISYFLFYLHGNDKDPLNIPYNGENYLKIKRKIPTLSQENKLQNKVEAYSDDSDKSLFKIIRNSNYVLKYPFGPLPSNLDSGIQNKLQKENFRFTDLQADYEDGDYRGMGYSDKSVTGNIDADFDKNLSDADIKKRIDDDKSKFQSHLGSGKYANKTPDIKYEEFTPIDKAIEKIYLINACGSTDSDDRVFYDCEAYVYVIIDNEYSESKKIYPFWFRKSATNMDPASVSTQMEEFSEMIRNFAKNITMRKYPEKEVEDLKQKILLSSNMNSHPVFKDYDLHGELQSSGLYNEIMAGGEPGVEVIKKEKKKMEDREFKISFKFNNETTIWNTGIVNTGTEKDTSFAISVNIDGKAFDKDKKEIEVSDEELYRDVYLMYEIINPKSQIHFQKKGPGENKLKVKVDDVFESEYLQSTGPILYKGPYLPTEYVAVSLVNKSDELISKRFIYKVHMKDASPRIEMEKDIVEIDDVADSIFKFRIVDEFHDKVECFVKIPYEKYQKNKIPFIKISEEGQGAVSTQIQPFECETNKWISIRVQPPKLSNFNMLSELNGLNMWDLQKGTMETFALDLAAFAVDRRMLSLGKSKRALSGLYEKGYTGAKGALSRADKIEKTMRFLDRGNDLAGKAQNAIKLTQMGDNIDSHVKDIKKASGADTLGEFLGTNSTMAESGANIVGSTVEDMKKVENGGKTTLEAGYEWGIAGINVLQSTVGAIAMAPGKIPVVGKYAQKVTGTFSLVFNLMTNVWKGNLEYLSKEKKLDRAQEKNIPYPAMVGVSTKEGFSDIGAQVISVLYTYLEK